MGELTGKVALITGASLGIGRGIATTLAEAGANVVVNYRRHRDHADEVAAAVKAFGVDALCCQADVAQRDDVEAMFAQSIAHFGSIDIVVANAAQGMREPVISSEWADVQRVIDVSQFGAFHTCQFAAQQMVKQVDNGRPGGKIIIISSLHEEVAVPTAAAYNMAKAAINHLGRTMAIELARYHINVNMINPGWIDTEGERAYSSDAELEAGGKRIPWGRLGTASDIAELALFLASERSDYITGTTIRIDGGYLLGMQLPPTPAEN